MERRDFFKWGLTRAAGLAMKEAEQKANKKAAAWIRPPYALSEFDFLLKCTRCGDCIEACPHEVLFPLPAKYGLDVTATPAMDLLNTGCRMCSDWPCVTSCEVNALVFPSAKAADKSSEQELPKPPTPPPPKLAYARIDRDQCLPFLGPECGACADICPGENAIVWNGPKPEIDETKCTGCAMCREVCVVDPKAVVIQTRGKGAGAKAVKKSSLQP